MEKYKSNSNPWPWQINKPDFIKQFIKTLLGYLFNLVVLNAILYYFYNPVSLVSTDFAHFPSFPLYLFQFIVLVLLEDFFFYLNHRFLHMDFIYKYIHKQHHENVEVITISCFYTHPLEFIIDSILTFIIP